MIRINQKEYGWGDIIISVMGRPIAGVTGIEYKTKKAKEARFGAGRHAKSIQHGKREVEGTLTIMQSEVIAMNNAAKLNGYKDLLDLEVNIAITYLSESGIVANDRVVCASFSEIPAGMKEGDLQSEHALPFIALDIEYGI